MIATSFQSTALPIALAFGLLTPSTAGAWEHRRVPISDAVRTAHAVIIGRVIEMHEARVDGRETYGIAKVLNLECLRGNCRVGQVVQLLYCAQEGGEIDRPAAIGFRLSDEVLLAFSRAVDFRTTIVLNSVPFKGPDLVYLLPSANDRRFLEENELWVRQLPTLGEEWVDLSRLRELATTARAEPQVNSSTSSVAPKFFEHPFED